MHIFCERLMGWGISSAWQGKSLRCWYLYSKRHGPRIMEQRCNHYRIRFPPTIFEQVGFFKIIGFILTRGYHCAGSIGIIDFVSPDPDQSEDAPASYGDIGSTRAK